MNENHICAAAQAMARTYTTASVPLYGKKLRLPDRQAVILLIKDIRRLIFPAYYGEAALMSLAPEDYAALLLERIEKQLYRQIALTLPESQDERAAELAAEMVTRLPQIARQVQLDLEATFDGDPAAGSREEILFSYPGLFAIMVYRVAHELYRLEIPILPRMMSEYAHSHTGIVVGETTVIGDRVKLYQGVTLGALSTRDGHHSRPGKRHPTVEDDVTIYSGASILGGETVIGRGSVVGGNAFLTDSVQHDTRVVIQAPETVFKTRTKDE